jgi:hypothetical protein
MGRGRLGGTIRLARLGAAAVEHARPGSEALPSGVGGRETLP